jgi:hypothetical protein
MSYKHLAGRLIETQRSMLGEPAIEIARSTEGITVTDDGTVTGVEGDGRAVVDELARRYTDMLGSAAEMRLLAAAREFEDELSLPASLGGHADVDPAHRDPSTHDPAGPGLAAHDGAADAGADDPTDTDAEDGDPAVDDSGDGAPSDAESGDGDPATLEPRSTRTPDAPESATEPGQAAGAHGPDPDTGAVSDGGAVESGSSADGATRVVSPTPSGPNEVVSPTPSGPTGVVSPTPGSSGRPREDAGSRPDGRVVETPDVSTTADSADAREDGTGASGDARGGEPVSYERAVDDDAEIDLEDPVTTRYTVASDLGAVDDATADLSSVYLLPDGAEGWQVPVAVEEAVASAVAEALDCEPAAVGNVSAAVDVDRLLPTLRGERGDTVSFELRGPLRGLTVTFHHTGALAIH